jgi:hypothetical protein
MPDRVVMRSTMRAVSMRTGRSARFQALLEGEVISSIQVLRGVPEVRDIFCIFREKISSMMHTLYASAEKAFAHEPKAMKSESTR